MTAIVRNPNLERLGWASGALLAVFAVAMGLEAAKPMPLENSLMALLMVVLVGAWYGGLAAGLTATAASLLVAAYFFMPPLHSFYVASRRDMADLALAGTEGLLISWLCEQRRRSRLVQSVMAAGLEGWRTRAKQRWRALGALEDDFEQLRMAVPEYLGSSPNEQRIAAFATALQEFARTGRNQPAELISSRRVFTEVIHSLEPLVTSAEARILLPDKLPEVCIRKSDLQRILTEIFKNAVQYRSSEPPMVRVSCREEKGKCTFEISDNGVGMIPLRQSKAFTLFGLRPAVDADHLSIGLALTRRIVQSYGGDIWLRSLPGNGTTVYFSVPVASHIF